MKNFNRHRGKSVYGFVFCSIFIALFGWYGACYAHGGKSHEDNPFTALQALQKATELYDQLLIDGKLDDSWETQLVDIAISDRQNNGKDEIVVSFRRAKGSPDKVFIFFTVQGEYAGSNFSGQ